MLWIFDRTDKMQVICSNDMPNALPLLRAEMHEVLNGDINLEFEVPLDHKQAEKIQEGYSAAVRRRNGKYELFIISEIEQIKDGGINTLSCSCRHAVQELNDEIIEYYFADRKAPGIVLPALLNGTRWTAGTTKDTGDHDITVENESVLEALQTFIKRWNGEIDFEFDITSAGIEKRTIHFYDSIGQDAGRRWEWSRDLQSLSRTISTDGMKTALVGIGKNTDESDLFFTDQVWTTSGGDPAEKPSGQNFIEDPAAKAKWGWNGRNRLGFYIDKDISDPALLLQKTWDVLQTINKPTVSYKIKVLDIASVEGALYKEINKGDTGKVIDRDLNLALSARCLEIKHDLLEETETELMLESFQPSITGNGNVEDPSFRLDEIEKALDSKLDRGEEIKTDWLEEEINLLTHRLKAGGGTVTLSDGQGILIEEDPVNKAGGALRLLGGTLALADTYNFGIGDYDWRSFGTGSGWIGDLIQTGKLTFNNARGGTLELGGQDDQNGVLIVRDSGGINIAQLSGDYGGFGELSIDELRDTRNIVFATYEESENLGTDKNIYYYIDAYDGSDSNPGTELQPLASIQEALNRLPKYLNHDVYIYFNAGFLRDNGIVVEGFHGLGVMHIQRWEIEVRYIRNEIQGSSANIGNHWVEVQAILGSGGTRTGDTANEPGNVTSNVPDMTDAQYVSDGNTETWFFLGDNNGGGGTMQWVEVYLGGAWKDLKSIHIWHYYSDGRTYKNNKTQISTDKNKWYTVFDSNREGEYAETAAGKTTYMDRAYMKGNVLLKQNSVTVYVNDLFVDCSEKTTYAVQGYKTQWAELENCVVFGNENMAYAAYAHGSNMRIINGEINTAKDAGVCAAYGGFIDVVDMRGSGFPIAMLAVTAAVIGGSGKGMYATTLKEERAGGQVSGSWVAETGEFSPVTIVEKTETWRNNDSQSYNETAGSWHTSDKDVLQGKYNSWGLYRGTWFFGTDMRSTVNGKEIKRIRVRVIRANKSGLASAVPIYLMTHGYSSKPSYAPSLHTGSVKTVYLSRGEAAWVDCTNEFKTAFNNGSAYGIGIYTSSTSNSRYARLSGTCHVEITYNDII
jgi:phage minor structural protein